MGDITRMMQAIAAGNTHAAEELLPIVYDELRKLAAQKLAHENPGQTLQATALVHEAWLRLVREEDRRYDDSRHFFYAAAKAMQRILVERARRKEREKHGCQKPCLNLEQINPAAPLPDEHLLALHEALEGLAKEDPEAARLVELRFFAGLTHRQATEVMGLTRHIADGLWAFARAWLFTAISGESPSPHGILGQSEK